MVEFKKTARGAHYFIVKANNGCEIVQSHLYITKASAEKGYEALKRIMKDDRILL